MRPPSTAPSVLTAAVARWAAGIVAAAACAATVGFALGTLSSRPLDGTEGHLLFDASRIRDHLRLYVDPFEGAWSYGPVPSRTYVLHTPLWAAVLSLLPASMAAPIARALCIGAWLGLLAGIAWSARPGNRGVAWLGALFLGGAYPLTLFAAAGRHDAPALLLAGVALLRSMRRGRAGALEGALFALAAFLKPNVVGAGAGVLACTLVTRGRSSPSRESGPALAGLAAVTTACVLGLQVASDGAWVHHLVASTQTTPMLGLWLDQMASRLPFFALPLAAALGVAWRGRFTRAGRVGLWALLASTAWTIVSLAKVGSASNYWMEPCVVALAIASLTPLPAWGPRAALAASGAALLQASWVGTAAIRSSWEGVTRAPRQAAMLADAREACGAGRDDVVIADEAGIEMMLNGRAIQMPFVMTRLARDGRYPLALWQADVRRASVRCLVMQSDLLERPPEQVDVAADLFDPAMRQTLRERFALVQSRDGLWIYGLRR